MGNDICHNFSIYFSYFFPSTFEQKFFKELEERKKEFGISDIQIGLTTLDEVFLNIAKRAELESAAAEGRLITLTLTSGASFQVHNLFYVTLYIYIYFERYCLVFAYRIDSFYLLTIILQIPVGAQLVVIPNSESTENPKGLMVEVYWDQDDSGNLRISGHSAEMPIPPDAQAMASSSNSNTNSSQTELLHAIVIDPSFLKKHD